MDKPGGDEFWSQLERIQTLTNEAEVERLFVLPLLAALGYESADIRAKAEVSFVRGTKRGRPFEADFVTYSGPSQGRDTSLMVVEVKAPGSPLQDAQEQGESYAIALRTPALLLTNGTRLQIWLIQQSSESEMLLDADVHELASRREEIERLIAKESLVRYCAQISYKKPESVAEFEEYERAEFLRTQDLDQTIDRSISDGSIEFQSTDLLSRYTKGAVITAPSGYGKTILAAKLLRQAINERRKSQNGPLAVDIPLLDLIQSRQSIAQYAFNRIAAHQTALSQVGFQKACRKYGLIIVCDGFERLGADHRGWAEMQLRTFSRDYSNARVFILSRGSALPDLRLPRLTLKPLSLQQRRDIVEARTGSSIFITSMPRLLIDLSEVPLLLDRILDFWISNQTFPNTLEQLFEGWLEQLLKGVSASAADAARRDIALTEIANELAHRQLRNADTLSLLISKGLGDQPFNDLVQSGALVVTNGFVEVVHEGFADFLRARSLALLSESDLRPRLASMLIDGDSLLPVFLVSLVRDRAAQNIVWGRLSQLTLGRYIDAIRFSNGNPALAKLPTHQERARHFFEDMLDGIDGLIDGFFPRIAGQIRAELASQIDPVQDLKLVGNMDDGLSSLVFAELPRHGDEARVQIAQPDARTSRHYINMELTDVGAGSGRLVGATELQKALLAVVQRRCFLGGLNLANERAIGRLRFLVEEHDLLVQPDQPIATIRDSLIPYSGRVVAGHLLSRTPTFSIDELIADLDRLLQADRQKLDWWWLEFGQTEEEIASNRTCLEHFLRAHFTRFSTVYSEVVEASFPGVSRNLWLYRAHPVQWHLAVVASGSFAQTAPAIFWHWHPLDSGASVQVECKFSEDIPDSFRDSESRFAELQAALIRLGRYTGRYGLSGMRQLPRISVRDETGPLTGETSVMRDVASYLASDIKALFEDLPNY